ncbi:MAG: 4-hydroxy-3-methylbut-2-enyl diphosphate reductase [Deltaproteobacteria bacterium]
MKVTVAKTAGFCWGVRRTVDKAFETAEGAAGDVRTLGPVIHNPQVIASLKAEGVLVADRVADVDDGTTLVVRTHGATKSELALAKERGLEVIDGTCPYVKVPQAYVQRMSRDGYHVLIVGDETHPEIRGVVSYAEGPVTVLAPGAAVPELPGVKKVAVVAQTTLIGEALSRVVGDCILRFKEVRAYNTICYDTDERQADARALAAEVDAVLVVGGKASANTRHLAEICGELQPRTHHVETAEDIDPAWFHGVEVVGVSAGASTPDWVIEGVVRRLEALSP